MAFSASDISLLFKAKGDTSDAKKAFNDLRSNIGNDIDAIESKGKSGMGGLAGSFDLAGLSAGGMAGPVGIAAGAVVAIGTAAIAAGVGLFNLAKSASEWGSEIFDASEKTGLGAETLSAMKFAADQSGTSLDAITSASAKFAKTIGDAADGSEKAQKKLDNLNVTSKDLDTALGQALTTIASYPAGVEQMTAAQDAFGKSGSDLLPFIKSFDGDLPGLIAKAKELGVTMSDEDARAADEFGDQMDTLNAQLSAVARMIGIEVMPIVMDFATRLSNWLSKNKGEIKSWAENLVTWANYAAKGASIIGKLISGNYAGAAMDAAMPSAPIGTGVFSSGPSEAQKPLVDPAELAARVKAAEDAKKAAEKRAKEREELAKREAAAQIAILKDQLADAVKAHEDYYKTLKERFGKDGNASEFRSGVMGSQANLDDELQSILPALEAAEIAAKKSAGAINSELELLDREQLDRIQNVNDAKKKIADEANAAILAGEKKAVDEATKLTEKGAKDRLAIQAARSNTEMARLALDFQKKALTETQYLKRIQAEELSLLKSRRDAETDKVKRAELDEEIKAKELEHARALLELEQRLRQEKADSWAEYLERERERIELEDAEQERKAREELESGIGGGFAAGLAQYLEGIALVEDANGQLHFSMEQVFTSISEMGLQAFSQLAAGFGEMVANWVLYGDTGGKGLRKMFAQVLAGVAQTAATYAILCLAAAALATTVWGAALLGGTPAQFLQAAALFGAVAVTAAVAGRLVAGDAFKKESSGAFGTAGSSSGGENSGQGQGNKGGVFSSKEDQVIEIGRNQPGGILGKLQSEITLKIESTSAHIIDVVKENINNNGQLRTVIQDAT